MSAYRNCRLNGGDVSARDSFMGGTIMPPTGVVEPQEVDSCHAAFACAG
jgi:hypothetical protein